MTGFWSYWNYKKMEPNPILDKYADAFIYRRNVDQLIMDLLMDLLNTRPSNEMVSKNDIQIDDETVVKNEIEIGDEMISKNIDDKKQDKTESTHNTWTPESIQEYIAQYRLAYRTTEYDNIKILLFSSFHKHQVHKMLKRIYRYLRMLPGYNYTALIISFATTIEQIKSMRFFSNDWRTNVLRDIEEALMIINRNKNTILEPLVCAPKTKEELIQLLQELGFPYFLIESPKSVFIKSSAAHPYKDKLAKRGIKVTEIQITE